MEVKDILENVKKREWYCQGGGLRPGYIWHAITSVNNRWGPGSTYSFQTKEYHIDFFDKFSEKNMFEKTFKAYLEDPGSIKKMIKEWWKLVEKEHELLEKLNELPDDFKEIVALQSKISQKAWTMTLMIEESDVWGQHFIQKFASVLSHEEINTLCAPENLTFLQQEKIDRLEVIENDGDIGKHHKKYHWYLTSWQEKVPTDVEYFQKLVDNTDVETLRAEVKEIKEYISTIKDKKKDIKRKHDLSGEALALFSMLTELNDFRDDRKREKVCKSFYIQDDVVHKIAVRNGLSPEQEMHMGLGETDLLLSDKFKDELTLRTTETYMQYYHDGNVLSMYGEDAEKVLALLEEKVKKEEISGNVAFNGTVRGTVRVINTVEQFSKMSEGDVLVSIMTRPEMVPVMKKACAIVTDEGGVTCHAAIVSRELKIPCIVGTQTASRELKDGDVVEVDAEKGIVRKVE